MNTILIAANILTLLTFIIHTFGGDKELRDIQPDSDSENWKSKQIKWLMARGAFHIVSADFLLATAGLTLINFTDFFEDKILILRILAVYFFAYGIAFLMSLIISKKFKNIYIKLWQWVLMFIISGLIYLGTQ